MRAAADFVPPATGWLGRAGRRCLWLWPCKALGTPLAIAVFLAIYFLLLHHPLFAVTVMPLTKLDRLIPFQPWSIVPYASLWLYISFAAALVQDRQELLAYLCAVVTVALVGFLVFLLWPTAIPDLRIDWARYPSVSFLKSVDATGNACPSLHAAFVTLSAAWLHRQLGELGAPYWLRALNIFWCLLVLYSTLATKQHVCVDLGAGTLLGLVAALPFLARLARKQSPGINPAPR